ncbi:MAG: NAD(P)/FAD-dependent oxidoreductase [Chloroflexi bacterium]|nr:NAD(P)/FAD-dependent oxidoreductase [Chloroflexota bacterium]
MADETSYDVIVIGAGAAGLFAAGQAATQGARVLLLEKMNRPGRKLQITGKGRCNLTNTAPLDEFIDHFGPNGRFLRQAFGAFFADDLIQFLNDLGVETITERGGRVFPASEAAQDVVETLGRWNHDLGVVVENHAPVDRLLISEGKIGGVQVGRSVVRGTEHPRRTYHAPAAIVTTGGQSYPGTGSTGDGYRLATSAGHSLIPVRPALVPLETAGKFAEMAQGLSLKNVAVSLWIDGKKTAEDFGEMLFTHFGLSGPVILSLSRQAVDGLAQNQRVMISIDLKPALDDQQLDQRLLRDINQHSTQQFENWLKDLLPRSLIPVCIEITRIPADKVARQITAPERKKLRMWLKDFHFEITRARSFHEAIVTAGGVALNEIDPRTMQSRLVEGLYFAGEVLDLDADTGGYNLQAAFSTGWLAGCSAGQRPARSP